MRIQQDSRLGIGRIAGVDRAADTTEIRLEAGAAYLLADGHDSLWVRKAESGSATLWGSTVGGLLGGFLGGFRTTSECVSSGGCRWVFNDAGAWTGSVSGAAVGALVGWAVSHMTSRWRPVVPP